MNTNKREEKKCNCGHLQNFHSNSFFGRNSGRCNSAYCRCLRFTPSLPQNGDREKECEHLRIAEASKTCCLDCGNEVPYVDEDDEPSAEGGNSEGKEKEPKECAQYLACRMDSLGNDRHHKDCPLNPSALAEKELKECNGCARCVDESVSASCFKPNCDCHSPSALAEKETAPKTDWEERFESIKIQCADDSENHNREIKAFIQTLLKEKDEEFVEELLEHAKDFDHGDVCIGELIGKYSPKDKN